MELDTYRLILETLTAFGTVGAVIISLWMSRPNKPRFKVKAVDSRIDMSLNKSSQLRLHEHYLLVNIENLRDVQMQVFSVFLRINKDGSGVELQNTFIPALNSYNVKASFGKDSLPYTIDKKTKIICEVLTSFGDKAYTLTKKETLLFKDHIDHIKGTHCIAAQADK